MIPSPPDGAPPPPLLTQPPSTRQEESIPPPSRQPQPTPQPLLIALAGPTSSGKTTLAAALAAIFAPPTLTSHSSQSPSSPSPPSPSPSPSPVWSIIHLDDLYLPDRQIPLVASPSEPTPPSSGTATTTTTTTAPLQDWDTPAAFDYARYVRVLRGVRRNAGVVDWEEVRDGLQGGAMEVGVRGGGASAKEGGLIPPETIAALRAEYLTSTTTTTATSRKNNNTPGRKIILVEGLFPFLPPSPSSPHTSNANTNKTWPPDAQHTAPLFDIRILLRTTRTQSQTRRAARSGYTTLEGFWADPPGYFENVVWPGWRRVWSREGQEGTEDDGEGEGELAERAEGDKERAWVHHFPPADGAAAAAAEQEEGKGKGNNGREVDMDVDVYDVGEGPEGMQATLRWILDRVRRQLDLLATAEGT